MGTDTPISALSTKSEAAVHLLQAELRTGDQPADRPDPRGARHEPRVVHRTAAEPVRSRRHGAAEAPRGAPADPDQRGPREDPLHRPLRGFFRHQDARHHLCRRPGRCRHGGGVAAPVRAGRSRRARPLQHHHPLRPHGRPLSHSDPRAAGDRGGAPSPGPQRPAHFGRAGRRDGRSARNAPFRLPGRLRRRGDQSVPRVRDAAAIAKDLPEPISGYEVDQALHQVDRQGPAEGHVEDGHLDLPVLLRRADLRRGRPFEGAFVEEFFFGTATTIEGAGLAEIAEETLAVTPTPSATRRCCGPRSTSAANTPIACAAKRTAGRRRRYRCCSTPCAATRATVHRLRQDAQRAERAVAHDPRPSASGRRRPKAGPVPLDEVEPAAEIVKRFSTGACPLARSRARRIRRSPSR